MTVEAIRVIRSGAGHWWHSFLMMTRWEIVGLRLLLPITVFVQVLTGAGFVLGVGLFFDRIPPQAALFVSTGVVVITLATVGLVLGPQLIAAQKAEQTYDFIWSLPVPRSTAAAAWIVTNTIIAVPGMVMALLVANWRYDIELVISAALIPGALLTLYTATMVGYAIAHTLKQPMLINLITQVTIFATVRGTVLLTSCSFSTTFSMVSIVAPISGSSREDGKSSLNPSSKTTRLSFELTTGRSVQLMRSPTSWLLPTTWPCGVMYEEMWQVAQVGAAV